MKKDYEKIGIKISIVGSFLFVISSIIMALIAKSQAILLDGLYTFITLIMAFISLRVIDLVNNPETKDKPFGYMVMEPFLNLIKSLVMLMLLAVFLISNIQELSTGGRIISLNMTTLYIFICLCIYFIIIFFLKKCEKETNSSILRLEVKNWRIDTLLTFGIAVSLVVAIILFKLGYTKILPYIDPSVVIMMTLLSLPVPLRVFLRELKRLLLISNENNIDTDIRNQIQSIISKYGLTDIHIWALNSGRTKYFFLYLALNQDQITINYLDKIRSEIFHELAKLYPMFWADIIFTKISPEEPFPYKKTCKIQIKNEE